MQISFITPVASRLSHLKETLPGNLEAIEACGVAAEIIVVEYGETKGLRAFVETTEASYLDATDGPKVLNRARNAGARVAKGEILCALDADNFLAEDAIRFIDDFFKVHDMFTLLIAPTVRGPHGRSAILRADWKKVGGWDESLAKGPEDTDSLLKRAQKLGFGFHLWPRELLSWIDHPPE